MMSYAKMLACGVTGSIAIALLGVTPTVAQARRAAPDEATPALRTSCVTEDERDVAALDTRYQEAVKENDADTMDGILADDFVLVTGHGTVYKKEDFLAEARSKSTVYEHQEDSNRRVRVFGDTAVVTALLWAKGTSGGSAFDYKLWFSDVYLRTSEGWRYTFAQASIVLPSP